MTQHLFLDYNLLIAGLLFHTLATHVQQTHETNKTPKDIGPTEQDQLATPTRKAQSHLIYLNV